MRKVTIYIHILIPPYSQENVVEPHSRYHIPQMLTSLIWSMYKLCIYSHILLILARQLWILNTLMHVCVCVCVVCGKYYGYSDAFHNNDRRWEIYSACSLLHYHDHCGLIHTHTQCFRVVFLFGGRTLQCSGRLIPGFEPRDHSWQPQGTIWGTCTISPPYMHIFWTKDQWIRKHAL